MIKERTLIGTETKGEVNAQTKPDGLVKSKRSIPVSDDVPNVIPSVRRSTVPSKQLQLSGISQKPANAVQDSVPAVTEPFEQDVQNVVQRAELPAGNTSFAASVPASSQNVPAPVRVKEFTGDELVNKTFDCLPFTGKFEALIGKPSRIFSAIIWGLPKGGKSNLSVRFADYLQEYFGKTVYVASEEGESLTLQEKFRDIGGSKMTIVELRDKDKIRQYVLASDAEFVFIDSINNAGIEADFLEEMKTENPAKSFIGICQATKSGNFKGDQAITHNCDFMIKIVAGIASQLGRFGPSAEMPIFDEPLYEKNPTQRVEVNFNKVAASVEREQGATPEMGNIAMLTRPKETVASLLPSILKALEHHALSKSAQVADRRDDAELDEENEALSDKEEGTCITTRNNNPFVADWEDMESEHEVKQVTAPKYNLALELALLDLERKYPAKTRLNSSLGNVSAISSSEKGSRGKNTSPNAKDADVKKRRKSNKPADEDWGSTLVETGMWLTGIYVVVNWNALTKNKQQGGGRTAMR